MNFTMYRGQNIPLMTRRTNFEILLVFYSSDPFGESYEMGFPKGAGTKSLQRSTIPLWRLLLVILL
jgi:hypothetical protein